MPSITRPAALVRQGSLKLYTTSITVRELKIHGFYQINKLDPEDDGPGFQRLLNQGRAKKLSDYLLDGPAPKERQIFSWSHQARVPASPGCYVLTTFSGGVLYVGLATVTDPAHN